MFENIKEHLADKYSVGYMIYLHRSKLVQLDKSQIFERSQSKLKLTDVMLSHAFRDYYQLTTDETTEMKLQTAYAQKLENRMEALKKLKSMNQVKLTLVPKRRLTRRTAPNS